MAKKCKNCGAVMPDEASTCLTCFSTQAESVATEDKKIGILVMLKSKLSSINKKKTTAIVAVVLCALLILPISINAITNGFEPALSDEIQEQTTKKAVSSTTKTDGSIITEFDDGSVETQQTDGTVITEEKDGTVITKNTDGTKVTTKKDGTKITETVDGTKVTEDKTGTKVTETPDGTTIIEKPDGTVITENSDGTTEITQISTTTTTTTTQPTTETTTNHTTTTTTTTTDNTTETVVEQDSFEFERDSRNRLCITKYTGNSKVVTVPSTYNGENIYLIKGKTFENNSKIEKIIFQAENNYNPVVMNSAVYNCSNLKSIKFNWSDYSHNSYSTYGSSTISAMFAYKCFNLNNIQITNNSKYKVHDNSVYYYTGSTYQYQLIYLNESQNSTEYHQPDWCRSVQNKIFKNYYPNIQELYINPAENQLPYYFSNSLSAIHISESNQHYFDDNGVVYSISNSQMQYYPPEKTDTNYIACNNYKIALNSDCKATNSHLKILTVPANVTFCSVCIKNICNKSSFTKLETIHIENENPHLDYIQQNFDGEVIVY